MTKALIFDCDGVLAETERDGHRVAFNTMFGESGLPVSWDPFTYGQRLKIAGGKERLRSLFSAELRGHPGIPAQADAQSALVARWHKRKTEIYTGLILAGRIAPRTGVKRIAEAAAQAGWRLAVASTSAEPSVRAVLQHAIGENLAGQFSVFAGDLVSRKKPAPDIYLAALEALGCDASEAVAIEDSANGVNSARSAGLPCLVTLSEYSCDEDLSGGSIVVSELGDPGLPPVKVLWNRTGVPIDAYITLTHLEALMHPGDAGREAS